MKFHNIKKRYYIYTFLLFHSFIIFGQNHFVFFPIDSKDGLSGNKVRSIGQLPDGRLIIVAEGLVNLYDGKNFKYLHFKDEKTYHLSAYNGYHRMYVDNNNGLWIKNWHRLMYFNIENETFCTDFRKLTKQQNIKDTLADVFFDSHKNLWYLTNDNKLYLHDFENKKSLLFVNRVTEKDTEKDQLYDIATIGTQLFLFYKSGLLSCYDLVSHDLLYEQNPLNDQGPSPYQVTLMVVAHKKYLYQIRNGTNHSIMLRYNVLNKRWKKILEVDNRLNTLTVDNDGNCFVSTLRGFWFISENLTKKEYIPEVLLEDGRIFDTEISTQYTDLDGGLWVGTLNRGLLYYHPNRFLFRNYGLSLFNDFEERNLMVNCITETGNNPLIGTNNGVYKKHNNSNSLIRDTRLPSAIICNAMLTDRKDRTWISTKITGVYCAAGQNVEHYKTLNNCRYIYESFEGHIFLFSSGGIYVFSDKKNKFILVSNDERLKNIHQATEIETGLLLCISRKNINTIRIRDDKIEYTPLSTKLSKQIKQFSNHQYNSIYFDSRGLIWVGTQDGINIVDFSSGQLKTFQTENGLVNNCVQSIIEDDEKQMWVSTSNGISKIDVQENNTHFSFYNYNHYDGVIGSEFLTCSAFLGKEGKIYWGGLDGFNEINSSNLNQNSLALQKPILSNLYISGVKIDQNTEFKGKRILNKSLAVTENIELKHHQNFISIEFSAMNYINALRTFYRYQLKGFDNVWHASASTNGVGNATYTNLPPGQYQLKIQSSSKQNKWGNDYRVLNIEIKPPLWKTLQFYTLYALLFILAWSFSMIHFVRKGRRKRAREQKEALDQMKFSFFTNVSHELRTPLTLIITPLNSIIQKIENEIYRKQLIIIKKNADDLLTNVNQLLDFRKLEMGGEQLQLIYCNVNDLIIAICLPFDELAKSKKIDFSLNIKDEIHAYIDPSKTKKIIKNLLSNAFKFTPNEGSITLNLFLDHFPDDLRPSICIEVKDSGCGIPSDELELIFDRFYRVQESVEAIAGSGIGLHMVKEYIQMHKGIVTVESEVNKGSRFLIYMPTELQSKNDIKLSEDTSKEHHSLKIILAEDNKDFRDFLYDELSTKYSVIASENGIEALAKIKECNPDIIISDYGMPEMNGYELCKKVKNDIHTSHIPFIMLTARTSEKDQIQSFEAGADAFISKPFNLDLLLLRIRKLIEQQQQRLDVFKNATVIKPKMIASSYIDEELMKKALICIENNIDDPSYSIDHFSKDMHMDRTGLFRKLKALVGQSPSAFLKSIRLKKSTLLLEKGIPVSEVAEMVGFSSLSYFSKCFNEEFGMKASQWDEKKFKS